MNIYIVTFCGFKGFLSKPEIRAELVPAESEEIVRKSAKNIIQQFFSHYARVIFEVQKLDKRKIKKHVEWKRYWVRSRLADRHRVQRRQAGQDVEPTPGQFST